MESPLAPDVAQPQAPEPTLGLGQRAVAVFIRPGEAWTGLRQQVQWWFPMLLLAVFAALVGAALQHRALLPMLTDAWQDQVAIGNMQADQAQHMEEYFSGPMGMVWTVGQQLVFVPVITAIMGLLIWFGAGFILGRSMTYRLSLEVASWAGLITIPLQALTFVVAWARETMKGVHVGFGLLLPETDTPTRFGLFLGGVLDAFGPLSLWYLAVLVLGTAALSGAPRKQIALVIGGLYFVAMFLLVGLGAMFAPLS